MSKSHHFNICRELYSLVRIKGCPVVHVTDLGCGMFAGETADGEILHEQINGCCKWSIKYELGREWLDMKKENK